MHPQKRSTEKRPIRTLACYPEAAIHGWLVFYTEKLIAFAYQSQGKQNPC